MMIEDTTTSGFLRTCFRALAMTSVAGAACAAAPADGFQKNSPGFRGPDRSGRYLEAGPLPTAWSEKDSTGILWKARLDLPGWASPIVWNDRVVVTSADADRRLVVCFDAASGKGLWKTEIPEAAGTTAKYELNTQVDEWNRRMHAAATPATDGTRVFALFSNGQIAALEMETGKVAWTIGLGDTSGNRYGVAGSPLVRDGSVIVAFQGEPSFIAAYDAATGSEKWKTPRKSPTWSSPVLAQTKAGLPLVVLFADPDVSAWNPETGELAWKVDILTSSPEYCLGPTPVFADGVVVVNFENAGIVGIDPDNGRKMWNLKELPNGDGFSDGVSMTTDGKHVYQYFGASLVCVEAKTGKLVAQKETDETATVASPIVAGGNIYLFGSGGTLVLRADPGAGFPPAGRATMNKAFESSPAAAGGRLYFRNDDFLYCIGSK